MITATMQICKKCVSMYTSYELTPITKVTGTTGMHTFHIIGICPLTKRPTTSHILCPTAHLLWSTNRPKTTAFISKQISTSIYHATAIHVTAKNKSFKCQIYAKLLNVHLWGKYANIEATYKVATINDVAGVTVNWWWCWWWYDATACLHILIGHLASQVKIVLWY